MEQIHGNLSILVPNKPQDTLLIVYMREISRLEEFFRLKELHSTFQTKQILDPIKHQADVKNLTKICYELICK
jgi:hypothetical protein